VPPGFNSGGFFDFLQKTNPKLVTHAIPDSRKTKTYIEWSANNSKYDSAISFVLQGIDDVNRVERFEVAVDSGSTSGGRFTRSGGTLKMRRIKLKDYASRNRAYSFDISHKETSFRRLSVPHPVNQFLASDFYEKYSSDILYYSGISPFSIRKPDAVAQLSYFNDLIHGKRMAQGFHFLEESHKEYDHLGSFFRYHRYSNVYRFYESKLYHNAEKKFDKLLKLDISRCFDSIYSHSISWAVLSKEVEKDAMIRDDTTTSRTFASKFDKLMQNMNDGETNGIIIGPEISRIFAELILQRVDREVERQLRVGVSGQSVFHRRDYEAYRYVDDYFLFYNSEATARLFCDTLEAHLRDFKLSLSREKQHTIEKPIITNETIAKNKIKEILADHLKPEQKEYKQEPGEDIRYPELKISANKLIVEFKTAIKSTSTTYATLLNFTLSNLEWRTASWLRFHKRALKEFQDNGVTDVPLSEADLSKNLQNLIEFSFFVFATTPKVNFSVRLTRLICMIVDEIHEIIVGFDTKESVLKSIADNLYWCLRKYSGSETRKIETLYLILANMKLGRYYRYNEEQLCLFLGAEFDSTTGQVSFPNIDMFTADVCLLYIRKQARYSNLRKGLIDALAERFRNRQHDLQKDAELLITFLDMATCPHLKPAEKQTLSKAAGKSPSFMRDLGQCHTHWFIDWSGFDLTLELDKKRSREVY
jgi:hypothetical protein